MKIEKGQLWGVPDAEFVINNVDTIEGEIWIHYTNTKTGQPYSCLEPAFKQRFSPIVNKSKGN